jgi:hypothetical protein
VYRAQEEAKAHAHWFETLEQMQQFTDRITGSWPHLHPVKLQLQRRDSQRSWCIDSGRGGITISPGYGANDITILHELAHVATPDDVSHGPEFCRAYLQLVRDHAHGAAAQARRLEAGFAAERVSY